MAMMTAEEGVMWLEIARTNDEIKAALWSIPADLDRAKLLISKRMGLRISLGEVKVRLKKPVVRILELAAAA